MSIFSATSIPLHKYYIFNYMSNFSEIAVGGQSAKPVLSQVSVSVDHATLNDT